MENKDAIEILGLVLILRAGDFTREHYAIQHCLTILKDYEQAKAGLPEEAKRNYRYKNMDRVINKGVVKTWNACLHQVALGMVKFRKRLPEILKSIPGSECWVGMIDDGRIVRAIMKEMGVGE